MKNKKMKLALFSVLVLMIQIILPGTLVYATEERSAVDENVPVIKKLDIQNEREETVDSVGIYETIHLGFQLERQSGQANETDIVVPNTLAIIENQDFGIYDQANGGKKVGSYAVKDNTVHVTFTEDSSDAYLKIKVQAGKVQTNSVTRLDFQQGSNQITKEVTFTNNTKQSTAESQEETTQSSITQSTTSTPSTNKAQNQETTSTKQTIERETVKDTGIDSDTQSGLNNRFKTAITATPRAATKSAAISNTYDGENKSVGSMPFVTNGDYQNRTPQPVEYDEGYVSKSVSKEAGQPDNEYTITLKIQGKSIPMSDRTDVVLVLDNSNSMGPKYNEQQTNRVAKANEAIKSFLSLVDQANKQSTDGQLVKVSLVTYGSILFDKYSNYGLTSDTSAISKKLPPNIPDDRNEGSNGGTFTQLALQKAQSIVAQSTASRKQVILLSDGAPTFSYKGTVGTSPENMTTFSTKLGYGAFYTLYYPTNTNYYNQTYWLGNNQITNHGSATISQANLMKAAMSNLTLSSIGVQLGDAPSQGVTKAETSNLLSKISSSSSDYYDAQDVDKLGEILKKIFYSEKTIQNGSVSDPMGKNIQLVGTDKEVSYSDPSIAGGVEVTLKDNKVNITGLDLGDGEWVQVKYKVKLDTSTTDFKSNTWYDTNGRTTLTPTPGAELKDFPIPQVKAYQGSVTLKKVGMTQEALAGATFVLQQKVNNAWQTVSEQTTSSSGILSWNKLTRGSYQLLETKAPEGYFLSDSDKVKTFELTDTQTDVNYTIQNLKYGTLAITKQDEAGKALQGAEFTLLDGAGNVVKNSQGQALIATTDTKGVITFTHIPYGSYKLKETKLPDGYFAKEAIEQNVTINQDQVQQNFTFTNYRYGALNILKVNEQNEPLSGAEFTVYDESGAVAKDKNGKVLVATTDASGKISFSGLNYGKYIVKETKAPKGYSLLAKGTEFTIDEKNTTQTLTLKNQKKYTLPKSGGMGPTVYFIVGVLMMVVPAVAWKKTKK